MQREAAGREDGLRSRTVVLPSGGVGLCRASASPASGGAAPRCRGGSPTRRRTCLRAGRGSPFSRNERARIAGLCRSQLGAT
eukprot:7372172-Heterocapsa_arctica.AAC.1